MSRIKFILATLALSLTIPFYMSGAMGADSFSLTLVSQNNNSYTFSYPQQDGFGYLYFTKASETSEWVLVSRTYDPSKTTVKFNKGSYSYKVSAIVEGETGSYTNPAPPPPSDTTAPSTPTNLSVTSATQTQVNLGWTASTDNVGVTGYNVYRGTTLIGSPTNTSFSDSGRTCGTAYQYSVEAKDAANNVSGKATVTASTAACATNDTTPPTVTQTAPADGSTVSGTIAVSANATDNVGVTKVDFFRDGNLIGSDTSSPYSVQFDTTTLPNGSGYTFGARGYDAAGNVGGSIQVVVTVNNSTTPPPPPPPTGGALKFSPPALSNPTTITVSNSNRYIQMNTSTDYIIKMPSSPLGQNSNTGLPALTLVGGRNVVLIGGEIKIDAQNSGESNYHNRGLMITGTSGTIHVEGLWIHGAGVGQGITFNGDGGGVPNTVRLQNVRIETLHPVSSTIHTDGIQTWGGPRNLDIYQTTIISNGVTLQTQPYEYGTGSTIQQWTYERLNLVHQTPDAYALWKNSGSGGAKWPEYHKDVWLKVNLNHPWGDSQYHASWADGNCWTCWNPGGSWPITGEAINLGLRPDGDFVPVGVAGINYVSPGYQ